MEPCTSHHAGLGARAELYDGSYWHADREADDIRKTAALTAAGWTVLRVREHPLQALDGVWCVPSRSAAYHATAAAVLGALAERDYLLAGRAEEYAAAGSLLRLPEAREAIADRAARETGRKHRSVKRRSVGQNHDAQCRDVVDETA